MAESLFVAGVDEPSGDFDEGQPTTFGTGLVFSVAGTVTHIRFRFPAGPTLAYVGVLYQVTGASSGTELARATFSSTPAGSWGTVALPAGGVAVSAGGGGSGTAYRAAVWSQAGRYTATGGYFVSAGKTSGHITAWQDDTAPTGGSQLRNGTFEPNADSYPTSFFNGGCYFVDVVFQAPTVWTYGFDIRVG